MSAKLFTGIAAPLILIAYFITVFYPNKKLLWSSLALAGAVSQLIGGLIYKDLGIIALESVFVMINLVALTTELSESKS
jgi:hypothetical protein